MYLHNFFFSNLLRAVFILQRTNFVSTKNIDYCVLSFLYVLSIENQAGWSQKKCRNTSTRGMSLAFSLYWMNDGGEEKKINWLLWSWRHLSRTCLYIETGICWIHLDHCLRTESLASKEIVKYMSLLSTNEWILSNCNPKLYNWNNDSIASPSSVHRRHPVKYIS